MVEIQLPFSQIFANFLFRQAAESKFSKNEAGKIPHLILPALFIVRSFKRVHARQKSKYGFEIYQNEQKSWLLSI